MVQLKKKHRTHEQFSPSPSAISSLNVLFSDTNLQRCQTSRDDGIADKKYAQQQLVQNEIENNSITTKKYRIAAVPSIHNINACSRRMDKYGLAILDNRIGDAVSIDEQLLNDMLLAAKMIETAICSRLDELKIPNKNITKKRRRDVNSGVESINYKFKEVSIRCLGRLDIRYDMNIAPFNDKRLMDPPFLPFIHKMLGDDAELRYCGLILSYPGSSDQPFHADGLHLFGSLQVPMHALNVFIPLTDITLELGPTEFIPYSHLIDNAIDINRRICSSENISRHVVNPLLHVGDVLFYDYRTIHRGTSNTDKGGRCRYMYYMLYSKPWFQETINFSDVSVFDDRSIDDCTDGLLACNEDGSSEGYIDINTMIK